MYMNPRKMQIDISHDNLYIQILNKNLNEQQIPTN